MRYFLHPLLILLCLPLFLWQCDDDSGGVQNTDPANNGPDDTAQKQVLVLNEGTFNNGNASLSIYLPDTQEVVRNVFRNRNGRPLGDVFQSMRFARQKGFLVINNSGKIEVVDSATLESVGVIRDLPSPRYLQPTGDGRGYVSNFTQADSSELSIVSLNGLQKTGSIRTGGWTGNMTRAAGRIWVPEVKAGWLLAVDPATDAVTDTVKLRVEVQQVVRDAEDQLWALGNGGIDDSVVPALYRIDPEDGKVTQTLSFSSKDESPGNLTLNGSRDTLYYTNQGIYRMPIQRTQLPQTPVVEAQNRSFYGLSIDPEQGDIYASDALDFVQNGEVYRFEQADGQLIHQFEGGIIPRDFVFP